MKFLISLNALRLPPMLFCVSDPNFTPSIGRPDFKPKTHTNQNKIHTNGNKTCVKNTINSEKIHTSTLKTTRSKQAPTILTSSSIHSSPYTISTRDQNFLKPRSPLFHQNKQSINQTLETKAQKTPQPADKQEPTELEQENSIEVAQITMDNNNISIHDKFLLNPLKYLENH